MSSEPEQWALDVEYLAKLADFCAGQGICQMEGLDDPEDWCLEAYDSFYPTRNGDDYSAQALADGLIASIQRAFEQRAEAAPVGYIIAEMLNRKGEFEANGIVMYDRPLGMATKPLYTHPHPTSEARTGQLVEMPSVEELAGVIRATGAANWIMDSECEHLAQAIINHLEGKRP